MFDFSMGELALIGTVALVILGPERLPKVLRTMGEWFGKAQRYVSQVKNDINREIELTELKKLQQETLGAAQSVQSTFADVQSGFSSLDEAARSLEQTASQYEQSDPWRAHRPDWVSTVFSRRYKPGLSVDELAEELTRVKHTLSLPQTGHGVRRKYRPRARVNRIRIRR